MHSIIILFFILQSVYCYEINKSSCLKCKWFVPDLKSNNEFGGCKLFKNTYVKNNVEVVIYDFAKHCRENEKLCGLNGNLFEDEVVEDANSIGLLVEDYNNKCCGEVNEKDELEQIEKDYFEILQRIKKFNKKRLYNTSSDILKLFKKNK